MKMGILILTVFILSQLSGGADSLTSVGNFLGSGGPSGTSEQEAKEKAEEAKRIAEEKQRAQAQSDALYVIKQKQQAPALTNKVIQFRLQQATNGNYFYQCKVATNYLKGTDGFPTNKLLAQYWLNQAMMNTNK